MTKKYILLTLAALLLLASCTKEGSTIYQPNPNEEQAPTTPLVIVIYGPNGLGDRSYNDLVYKGVEEAAKTYGVRTLQLAPESEEQGFIYLETFFRQMENLNDTVRRLFITPSPVYDDFIRKNNHRLEKNPNADLLYMETTKPIEGKGSTLYLDYYGAMYMGGCMVHYSSKELVSLVLANPHTQSVVEAAEGFKAGFNDTPQYGKYNVALHEFFLSNEPGGGFTLSDTTAMRIYEDERGWLGNSIYNDVTFVPICGGAMHPLIRAVRALSVFDTYVGIDGDMSDDKGFCVFSILKHIDKVMTDYVGMWLNGTMPKHKTYGLADGATDVVVSDYRFSTLYETETGRPYWDKILNIDSLRQVAIRKEGERYEKK
jgi:basic membrane protein A